MYVRAKTMGRGGYQVMYVRAKTMGRGGQSSHVCKGKDNGKRWAIKLCM